MNPQAAFLDRLAAARRRLNAHAEQTHAGLTPAHPGGDERWEAAQVWAHLAEFITYWIPQADAVIAGHGSAVPFGRTKTDAGRVAAIERGRSEAPNEVWDRLGRDLDKLDRYLRDLPDSAWSALGTHPTLGTMPLPKIIDEFLVGHLEEHAAQLDLLAPG